MKVFIFFSICLVWFLAWFSSTGQKSPLILTSTIYVYVSIQVLNRWKRSFYLQSAAAFEPQSSYICISQVKAKTESLSSCFKSFCIKASLSVQIPVRNVHHQKAFTHTHKCISTWFLHRARLCIS